MNPDWIDDLLAIAESGSLSGAAKQRFLTQPAFSRRIRAIEKHIGSELIDRTRKPAQLKSSVLNVEPRLREAAQILYDLKRELADTQPARQELILVGQHAISTAIAPALVQSITNSTDISIRLRSANRETCYSLLYSNQADIALLYVLDDENIHQQDQYVESQALMSDPLVPVIAKTQHRNYLNNLHTGELRIVAYPSDVFLGKVLHRNVQPKIDKAVNISWTAETALTTAALQFASSGIGLAWVPKSLAQQHIDRGELTLMSSVLPEVQMTVHAMRLMGSTSSTGSAWDALIEKRRDLS
ncbi:MAG: LysR family transcriptional regulator [Gammaproteobacteria bacterium]|nr:LysR family transcriptional regulator [Gammaproteobacteria bacterium]